MGTTLRSLLIGLTASLVLAAGAPSARADQGADLAAAQALVDEGNRAAAAADYETALTRFRAAYARYRSASVLLNIGTALHRLGRDPEAGTVYEQYLRDPGANPDRVAEIQRALTEIDAKVARVTIISDDRSARFWLDGVELRGFGGGMVRIAPGDHTVSAGREAPLVSEQLRLAPGEARSIGLRVPGAAPPAPPPVVPVIVPVVPPPAVEGEPEGEPRPRARREMTPLKGIAIALDVTGGLAIMGGIAAGVTALVQNAAANDHCYRGGDACEPRALELEADARKSGQVAGICFGVGTAALLTGVILGAVEPRLRDTSARRLPRVGFSGGKGTGLITLEASW